jgi:hypothetical protein
VKGRGGAKGDVPEETARGLAVSEADRVEVEGASAAGPERVLHGSLCALAVRVGRPFVSEVSKRGRG